MEYAKDIVLDLKNKTRKTSDKNVFAKGKSKLIWLYEKITKHKVMTTVITATVGFMILDIMLISSFVSVLSKIWN